MGDVEISLKSGVVHRADPITQDQLERLFASKLKNNGTILPPTFKAGTRPILADPLPDKWSLEDIKIRIRKAYRAFTS